MAVAAAPIAPPATAGATSSVQSSVCSLLVFLALLTFTSKWKAPNRRSPSMGVSARVLDGSRPGVLCKRESPYISGCRGLTLLLFLLVLSSRLEAHEIVFFRLPPEDPQGL